MLSKLIKHEWKDTWRMPAGLMLVLALLTVIGIFIGSDMGNFLEASFDSNVSGVLTGLYFFSYVIVVCFSTFAIWIYFILRFKNNMYGTEAYLMHSLPVSASEHIASKTIVNLIWTILSALGVLTSIAVFILSHAGDIDWSMFLADVSDFLNYFREEIEYVTDLPFPLAMVLFIFIGLFSSISRILVIYLSISIGQQVKKHKTLLSFVSFFLILYVEGKGFIMLSDLLDLDAPFGFVVLLILEIAVSVLYFACNSLLMSRRLNLE
ncbi:MAG: hypothetical protein K6A92_11315 [Lachnospiraceae bacterium]|nr:hypothetical protein [Lachnospiraceae bacterium]